MILRYEHGKLVEQRTYREALCLESVVAPVISIVGAGGKTTTVLHLAKEYVSAEIPVLVTTSTHMQIGSEKWFLLEESMDKLQSILKEEGQVWFGTYAPVKEPGTVRKMQAVSDSFFRQAYALQVPMIIEADGARHLPCKAPGIHEPVLVSETTDVLAVYGLDAVGKPIQNCCFRPERVAEVLKKPQSECLTPADIAKLALDRSGGRKSVLKNQRYSIILNKADNEERMQSAKHICREISEHEDLNILVTGHTSEGVRT